MIRMIGVGLGHGFGEVWDSPSILRYRLTLFRRVIWLRVLIVLVLLDGATIIPDSSSANNG